MSSPVPLSPSKQLYRRPLPPACIGFSSPEGKMLFKEALDAGTMDCYFSLAAQFRTQDEPAFCGLSTLVIVLNSLEVDPGRVWKGPWRWYHEDMLDCCVPLTHIKQSGITIEQFTCLAECNSLSAQTIRAESPNTLEDFRARLRDISRDPRGRVMVATYSRRTLGQTGTGHFSPLAGYNAAKDMVLILDTARFKYAPHWIPVELMWEAMQQPDRDTGLPRGYVVLSRRQEHDLLLYKLSSHFSILPSRDSLRAGPHAAEAIACVCSAFVNNWTQWLDMKCQSNKDDTFLSDALNSLLSSIMMLDTKEHLLTTRISDCMTQQHRTMVEDMIRNIKALPINTLIKQKLYNWPEKEALCMRLCEGCDVAECCPDKGCSTMLSEHVAVTCCNRESPTDADAPTGMNVTEANVAEMQTAAARTCAATANAATKVDSETAGFDKAKKCKTKPKCGDKSTCCDKSVAPLIVTCDFFITILLLSWPYRSTLSTNSERLRSLVPELLSKECQLVTEEVAQLRNQLAAVIQYMSTVAVRRTAEAQGVEVMHQDTGTDNALDLS